MAIDDIGGGILGSEGFDLLGEAEANEILKERRELVSSLNDAYKKEALTLRQLASINKTITNLKKTGAAVDQELIDKQKQLQEEYDGIDEAVRKTMESMKEQAEAAEEAPLALITAAPRC